MALRHSQFTEAGAVVAGIDVDTPSQHAAMIEKLNLPFSILSDEDRSLAITPYGLANEVDPRNIGIPTTVVIGADGNEAWRRVSKDFADRPPEDEALDVVHGLGLDSMEQSRPAAGIPEPGPNAMPLREMRGYYRGAKFAALAMGGRFPEAKEDAQLYSAQMDRYMEATTAMYRIIRDKTSG